MNNKKRDLIQITIIYILIAISGLLSYEYIPLEGELIRFLVADLVMTITCFAFSILKKNSSTYDAYWSVIPFLFVLQWCYLHFKDLSLYHYLTFVVVGLWSWRLTLSWARGWPDFSHEDWRYKDLADKTGGFYPVVNFLGIHLFPTLMVFVGMWPLFYLFGNDVQHLWRFALGAAISLVGIGFEYFADNQLAAFRERPAPLPSDLLDSGIWGRSRNPNYLGEMLFWTGLFVIGSAYDAPLYTISGSLVMLGLFLFISIPMKEERMASKRPTFEEYKKSVPKLLPKFW